LSLVNKALPGFEVSVKMVASRQSSIAFKRERLLAGSVPRVLDLFCGCGGLSLGFQRAGFEIVGGVEKDSRAAWTYAENIHKREAEGRRALLAKSRDINFFSPRELMEEFGFPVSERVVDVLVGGPPCQAYARVGRAKLREIQKHPKAFQLDDRGQLYLRYLDFVRELHPLALVIENVPDILSYGGRNIAKEIAVHLRDLGYVVNFGLLNAANYGVPQIRRRLYLIALCQELECLPSLPLPTHQIAELPVGYREFSNLSDSLRTGDTPFCGPAPIANYETDGVLPRSVAVQEAIGDLPRLTNHLTSAARKGQKRFDEFLPYARAPHSWFAGEMREEWLSFRGEEGICDHVTRCLPRDHKIFSRMMPGDDYPKAHSIAVQMFAEELERLRKDKKEVAPGSTAWDLLRKKFVPPYDPTKFPNKWRKMHPDVPARTLLAHLAHDSYTHIHYDDAQARTLSVREAARLQSFPDGFHFFKAMNPAFRMIGNAVPPLMAFRLAQHLLVDLGIAARPQSALVLFDQTR
jgi:DNA (cytosine-5)-methyltransferase 1